MPRSREKRSSTPPIALEFGKLASEDVVEFAAHLRAAGLNVEVPEDPSADVILLTTEPYLVHEILAWVPPVAQGLLATLTWEVVKWAVLKARKKIKNDDASWLRVRINLNDPNEIVISATNTGVWKSEKIPTDEKLLLPPRKLAHKAKRKVSKPQKRRGK